MNRFYKLYHDFFFEAMFVWPRKYRAILGFLLIGSEFLLYASWAWLVYFTPEFHQYVNFPEFKKYVPLTILLFLLPIFACVIIFSLKKENLNGLAITESIFMFIYIMCVGYIAHLTGELSIMTGIAISCTPVMGLLLFDRRVAYFIFLTNLGIFAIMLSLLGLEYIEDAPLLTSITFEPQLFWILSFFYFSVPKIFLLFMGMDMILASLKSNDKQIQYLSEFDALTNIYNRKTVLGHIHTQCQNKFSILSRAIKGNACLIMLDIDDFKTINDSHGHLIGDQVLTNVAKLLQSNIQDHDYVGRYGGEEFVVFLNNCQFDKALFIAENIRQKMYDLNIKNSENNPVAVTASIGVASLDEISMNDVQTNDEFAGSSNLDFILLEMADNAMYKAKNSGKNKICT